MTIIRRERAMTNFKGLDMTEEQIEAVLKALRRAWNLGQIYWRQADSEFWKQQDKSDETWKEFEALVDETRALLDPLNSDLTVAAPPASPAKSEIMMTTSTQALSDAAYEVSTRYEKAREILRWQLNPNRIMTDDEVDDHLDRLNSDLTVAAPPAAPAQSGGVEPLSVMRAAFRVTEVEGNPDLKKQRFHMRFTFRSMDELHAADDQWQIFSNAAPQPSQPVEDGEQNLHVSDMRDAYIGALEEMLIWKKRALKAEELNRKLMDDIAGPTEG
jgi:hypothetical protein